MGISILRSRKGAHPIMALIIGAVVIFIGIYTVTQVIGSISLPTTTVSDSLVFVNNTAKSVTYPYINSLTSVANSTPVTVPTSTSAPTEGSGCWMSSSTQITCYFNDTHVAGTYTATYVYNPQTGNDTYVNTQTTFWNSMQLGAVSLITLAASLVLGSFFFK